MIPQGYKHTELGVIPQEWEILPLSALGEIYSGGTPDTTNPKFWNGEILWCTPSDITSLSSNYISDTEGKITEEGLKKSSAIILPAGSLIVCTRATIGNIAIATKPLSTNQGFKNIVPYNDISVEWLFYNLLSAKNRLVKLGCGSTFLEVSKKDFERFRVAVPPVEEQRKIAEILGVWDKAIELQARLIDKLELRKRALMQRLLSGRHRLPGFSTPWQKYTYAQILKEVKRSLKWDDNEKYHLISVKRRSGGLFQRESLYGYEIKTKNLRPAYAGDFLISKMQIVHGASGLTTSEFHDMKISGSYIALVAKDPQRLNIEYFNLWSQMPKFYHHTYISSFGVHIEKMTFDIDSFMSLVVSLPSKAEQDKIVKIMTITNKEIELAKSKLAAYRTQKRGLMQQLLTGKKRIKI